MIQLKNVSKFYYSKGMIASGISKVNLTLDKGEFVVITGESGSGKSTLLNVISGLDSYEDGEMYINGQETSHYLATDFEEYRKKYIGNIFQNFNLVNSYTVYQNVELILLINGYKGAEIKKRVSDILQRVGMEEFAKTKVSKLSGGQKQRVAIARALAKDTEIIVADEPTGNLDSASAEGIAKLLSEIAKDKLVVVVTHNFEQFAPYASRKIKMHDGKIIEDLKKKSAYTQKREEISDEKVESAEIGKISAGSKFKLGIRNTFNIWHKFILLLIVFVFVVMSVTAQYTTYLNQKAESDKLGYNDYFINYSRDRIVLKKSDGSSFKDEDVKAIKNAYNVKSVAINDILLDQSVYIEDDIISYEAYVRSLDEFEGNLVAGEMPDSRNEIILTGAQDDYYFSNEMMKQILGKKYTVYFADGRETTVTVAGIAYKESDGESYFVSGDAYLSQELIQEMLKGVYNGSSEIELTINKKTQRSDSDYGYYTIVPHKNVDKGEAYVPEDMNNFFDNGNAQGQDLKIAVKNIYYSKSITLEMDSIYTEKNFKDLTGYASYDDYYGTIFISETDYNKLFKKGNYQASVYVNDVKEIDKTISTLESMGYVTMSLKDMLINLDDGLLSIIQIPVTLAIVVALFFIAYFVIRLILKSRAGYFSILRMLGLAKKHIRRIMDIELITVATIAYAIFLAFAALVKGHVINAEFMDYILNLVEYMQIHDYVLLYVIIVFMSFLISGKFARGLFKKTALGTFREED